MSVSKQYQGGCHCGDVRYIVNLELKDVLQCNCSICSKSGTLLAFTPKSEFTFTGKDGALQDYLFGKKSIHHNFCKKCGIKSFAQSAMPDGTEMVAINVRCLDGVDAESLPKQFYDGASL